jgi:sterol 14alpha-demethylase
VDASTVTAGRTEIPQVSGAGRFFGHMQALRHDPIALLERVRAQCGEVGELRLFDRPLVLMSGPRAQEAFFRAKDEQLDPQPTSNQMMKPIFGDGVVYDLPAERRREMMRTPALRDENLRKSAGVIARETERMLDGLDDAGEIDLLDFTTELTIYTSSSCLVGRSFRAQLTPEFARAYHDLEKGTDALGFINGKLAIEAFRVRDRARARLVELITEVIAARQASGEQHRDLLQILLSLEDEGRPRFSPDQVTGILVSTMFAGHHTSSATSTWALVEMLRHPEHLARVTAELDAIYAGGADVSYQALREIPQLENVVKETLRLHPPLILLPRTAMQDFHYDGWTIAEGKLVAVSPAVSHRDPACFREPLRFDPDRYAPGREEDRVQPWAWIPFGGGPHRCLGANFALMQLKAIFSILLRRYEFELAAPPESYRDDHSRMVVLPRQPCRVRYRRRAERGS